MDSHGQMVILWCYHNKNAHSSLEEPGVAHGENVDARQWRGS